MRVHSDLNKDNDELEEHLKCEVLKVFKTPLHREVDEGVRTIIHNGVIINSKTEWFPPSIVWTTIHKGGVEVAHKPARGFVQSSTRFVAFSSIHPAGRLQGSSASPSAIHPAGRLTRSSASSSAIQPAGQTQGYSASPSAIQPAGRFQGYSASPSATHPPGSNQQAGRQSVPAHLFLLQRSEKAETGGETTNSVTW